MEALNYIKGVSIIGMMNKFCTMIDDHTYWKDKKNTKLVVCRDTNTYIDTSNVKEISYMYLDEKPDVKNCYSMEQITSLIDDTFLPDNIKRTNHKELYETYHKYRNKITVITNPNVIATYYDEIITMIEQWRNTSGKKYRRQERAGVDKAFFKYYIDNINNSILFKVKLFIYNVNDFCKVVVGYSVISNVPDLTEDNIPVCPYMLRKCLTEFTYENEYYNLRNLTEYIDWYTFTDYMIHNDFDKLIINWGCSSGGVKWYKEHKWPLYSKDKKWFFKKKNDV